MKRGAVVTGASGFIGTRLVRRLASDPQVRPIFALDIAPPRERLPGVEYVQADIRNEIPASLGAGVDMIYNLAAVHRTPGHKAAEYYDTNVNGALQVTRFAVRAEIRTILFTSSIAVYGPSDEILTESSPLRPMTDYGRSKVMAERIHEDWISAAAGRRLIVVRPGVVFGPGENGNYTRLAQALRRGYFAFPGRRDTVKSGGYVDELLDTFEFAIADAEPLVRYNFADPVLCTTEEIVQAFRAVTGWRSSPPTLPLWPLLAAAPAFEALGIIGVANPIHRGRILKLVQSTKVSPSWLLASGYEFRTDLRRALELWREESATRFV